MEDGGINAAKLGKTSGFIPGEDEVAVLVYMPPDTVFEGNTNESYIHHTMEELDGASIYKSDEIQISFTEDLKFDGSNRTASLSKPAIANSFTVCRWLTHDLEQYFGGTLSLNSDDGVTVSLPPIPGDWYPVEAIQNATPAGKVDLINKYNKRINHMGIVRVKYNVKAIVFNVNVPDDDTLRAKFIVPPYEINATIYIKDTSVSTLTGTC